MTFALFGQVTLLGEVRAGRPGGDEQPLIDPAGRPIPAPDDGAQSKPLDLAAASAGALRGPDDTDQVAFSSAGLDVVLSWTDSRLIVLARNKNGDQWAGQVHYRWISDVAVRPAVGRRGRPSMRVLFLDPTQHPPTPGRQYVDLLGDRRSPLAELAWDLVQRIVVDRRRWIPPAATDARRQLDTLLHHGAAPVREPAWYAVPAPTVPEPDSLDQTVRILPQDNAPNVPAPPEVGSGSSSAAQASPWSPPVVASPGVAGRGVAGPGTADLGPVDTGLIASVPGVGRSRTVADGGHAADPDLTTGWVDDPGDLAVATPGVQVSGHGASAVFEVHWDDGQRLAVAVPTLLGRHPAPDPGEEVALVAVEDSTFSFSKTHLLLTPTADGMTVTDRHSTNGVIVQEADRRTICPPSVAYLLTVPATVLIGTRWMRIVAAPPVGASH